jgi:mannose/fructose/N-acetylgalactosamine-specific phosphotransferase system component IID
MLGSGFAFAMLPGLKELFAEDPEGLEASVGRHMEHFNAHPYLSGIAVGAALRMEADQASPEVIRRFKTAVRGPLGGLGDSLVWASALPAASLAALVMIWFDVPGWAAVLAFLLLYNSGHLLLRVWAFRAGYREGTGVAQVLTRAHLDAWTRRIRSAAALLLGLLVGAVVTTPGGLLTTGLLWVLLASVAFLGGLFLGHRAWRPAAAAVVVAVGVLATWGAFLS